MKIVYFFFLMTIIGQILHAQSKPDNLKISDKIPLLNPDNIVKTTDYFNWGGSIYKDNEGIYHLFYSRWKKKHTFYGWLTHSEIAHATSSSPKGPWEYLRTELKGHGKGYWDAITAHNPKIKFFDGKFYLYYISTNMGDKDYTEKELEETSQVGYSHPNWKILRPNQRTGVAVSNSINGPWERLDLPLIEPSGPITTLTVNPAIARNMDGKYYLVVKGDKPNETRFIRNQAVAISDSPLGPFKMQPKAVIDYMDTEDMSIWYDSDRNRFYGVFHAHSYIGLITSIDGTIWEKAKDEVVTTKSLDMEDGTVLEPVRMERPFVYVENSVPEILLLTAKFKDESYTVCIPLKTKSSGELQKKK
ncbi:glycoside hydrolase family protein [Fulvivirgaceae bacterium BMA10]|uniref:Glycoside hydrolase family protein n=1 Tax=Splendidivirga corallicola TaxID=3051826 RepID=A0ABT8KW60_9BACT|nr:glycoside hydrolase family protein [Fulvivirgaceae bacterium BMA10]